MRSLLTGSENVTILETVPTSKLIDAWKADFTIDITSEFHGASELLKYRCNDTGLICFAPANVAGSDRLYEQLQQVPWYYKQDKWEYRVARRELRSCRSIFEIGCGPGEFLKAAREDGHEVEGIELNARAAAVARKAGLNVSENFLENVAAVRKGAYDAALSFQVLEHVPDPAGFIRDTVELVRPGGRVVFAVPNSAGWTGFGYDLLQYPPHHMSWWTADCFRALESLFPIRVEKIVLEPLASDHVSQYVGAHTRRLREQTPQLRWLLNRLSLPVFEAALRTGLRRFCTGHTLYAQFVKL